MLADSEVKGLWCGTIKQCGYLWKKNACLQDVVGVGGREGGSLAVIVGGGGACVVGVGGVIVWWWRRWQVCGVCVRVACAW